MRVRLTVTFSEPILAGAGDLTLTNLGVDAPLDADSEVFLSPSQVAVAGRELTIQLTSDQITDGVYQLELFSTLSDLSGNPLDGDGDGYFGDAYLLQGNADNGLFRFAGDWNGSASVSIPDFPTLAYWFGYAVPTAPEYADVDRDGGVSIFDFVLMARNFGRSLVFPLRQRIDEAPPAAELFAGMVEQDVIQDRRSDARLFDWALREMQADRKW